MGDLRIYVADLAAYNNGYLHGIWIEATLELDEIWAQVKAMLDASPMAGAEEYAIHDHEGFGSYSLSEYEGLEAARDIACLIEEYGPLGVELLNYLGSDIDEARNDLEENYRGCYASLADYAQEVTEETTVIPKHLEYYIDYERMAADMECNGDIYLIETAHDEVHVFWRC